MTRWAPAKADVIHELGEEVLHNHPTGGAVVAVDGPDGSGVAVFADELAAAIGELGAAVLRISIEDFLRSDREVAVDARAERYLADAYDYAAFRADWIEPFRAAVRSARSAETSAPILVVDGAFLLRDELIGLWTSTVELFVPLEEAFPRAGIDPESDRGAAQRLYLHRVQPRSRATANIDNSDPEHPRRTFSDSC